MMRKLFIAFFFAASITGVWTLAGAAHGEELAVCGSEDTVISGETSGKADFKAGLEYMDSGAYREAAKSFGAAHGKIPVIGDYALFYKAKALLKEKTEESAVDAESTLNLILSEYPRSPIRRAVLETLIKAVVEKDKERALPLIETFIKDYPESAEMKYRLALIVKEKEPAKAKFLLKELYIGAGQLSDKSRSELSASDISTDDMIKRARNLIKATRYREAETALREVIREGGDNKKEASGALALSLFRQKRYKEAAQAYLKAGDDYQAAVSYFRAGELAEFNKTIGRLISAGDQRVGGLLVSYAADRRRDGKTEEALRILSSVMERYPSEKEQALWQTGWTHYVNGDYKEALGVFTALSRSHKSTKYLYWGARAAERVDGNAGNAYSAIEGEKDFYGLLAMMKNGPAASGPKKVSDLEGANDPDRVNDPFLLKKTSPSGAGTERFEALAELGLRREAVEELIWRARGLAGRDELISTAFRLKDMGEYRRAISLVLGLPEGERPIEVLYPLAFWPTLKESCSGLSVDPLLVLSVIREESRYDTEALSQAGAMGVMQLMPQTADRLARSLNVELGPRENIYRVDVNIRLGAFYLERLLEDFGAVPPALAAYNAGEQKVREWLGRKNYPSYDEFIEDIPYKETREYIKRILTSYFRYKELTGAEEPQALPDQLAGIIAPF